MGKLTIQDAIKAALEELRSMDRDELRAELQKRELGEIGVILIETWEMEK